MNQMKSWMNLRWRKQKNLQSYNKSLQTTLGLLLKDYECLAKFSKVNILIHIMHIPQSREPPIPGRRPVRDDSLHCDIYLVLTPSQYIISIQGVIDGVTNTLRVSWESICHTVNYTLYNIVYLRKN